MLARDTALLTIGASIGGIFVLLFTMVFPRYEAPRLEPNEIVFQLPLLPKQIAPVPQTQQPQPLLPASPATTRRMPQVITDVAVPCHFLQIEIGWLATIGCTGLPGVHNLDYTKVYALFEGKYQLFRIIE
jgi:hypothetical protein